jgi:hypothetical protein
VLTRATAFIPGKVSSRLWRATHMELTIPTLFQSTTESDAPCRRMRASMNRPGRVALLLCALLCAASAASAQNIEFTQGASGGSNMSLQVPIRAYPGRGSAGLSVTLYYSSRLWRVGYNKTVRLNSTIRNSVAEAIYAENSTAGWTTSLDVPRVEWPKFNDLYWYDGKPYYTSIQPYTYRVANLFIHMPDGSTHELRKSDQVYQNVGWVDTSGTFYAVDGSRLRYDSTGASTGTLYMQDGSRFILNGTSAQFIDRNGNTLNYDDSTRQWSDTLGRAIATPFPASPQATDYAYTPPGMSTPYIFKWRNLASALTPDAQGGRPRSRRFRATTCRTQTSRRQIRTATTSRSPLASQASSPPAMATTRRITPN